MPNESKRTLLRDARGAVYVEFLVAFLPTFTFFVAMLQLGLLYATHLFVEHAATVSARAAALSLADVPAMGMTVRLGMAETQKVRAAALLTLAPLVMDGSLNRVDVTVSDALGGGLAASFRPMTYDHVDMLRARVQVDARCKIPIGGRIVCGFAGGSGLGIRPSMTIAAESVFPISAARALPAAGCEVASNGSGGGSGTGGKGGKGGKP